MCTLREDVVKMNELRNECERLRRSENEARVALRKMSDLEQLVVELRTELEQEKGAKERANMEKAAVKKEADEVGGLESSGRVRVMCVIRWGLG